MTDNLTCDQRKKSMRGNRSRNTTIELQVRGKLWRVGLRYNIHSNLPGKPDIVFKKQRVVVFIDGCFWHKCPVCFVEPKTNIEYWHPKLERNVQRDEENNKILISMGWTVLRYYECDIKKDIAAVVDEIQRTIHLNHNQDPEP